MTSDRGKLRASTEPMTDCYYYIHKTNFRVFLTFTKFHFPSNITNGTCENSYMEILVGRDMVSNRKHRNYNDEACTTTNTHTDPKINPIH